MIILLDFNAGSSGGRFEAFKDKMEITPRLQSSQIVGVFLRFVQVFSLKSGLLQREGTVTHWA